MQEIEELLSKYSATKGHIFASTIWQLIIAGAEMEKSAITELEKQFQEARGKKRRINVNYSQRERIIKRDKRRCRYCGIRVNKHTLVIDHVIPWSRGGRNTDDNLVVACVKCNTKKGTNLLEEIGMDLLPIPD